MNGAAWQLVPPSEFTFNNYTAFLFSAEDGNTNPLAGQPAWTGTDGGTVNGGSWGRTHVDLGNLAQAGDSVRLRWNFGTDGCGGKQGWFLDNVSVFSCTAKVPQIRVADIIVPEGDSGESQALFTVLLTTPTIKPITVTYEIVSGTAQHGNDFDRVSGTVVIPALSATVPVGGVHIPVTIKGDMVSEGAETFTLKILGVTNATVLDGEAIATIVDDDAPGPAGQ